MFSAEKLLEHLEPGTVVSIWYPFAVYIRRFQGDWGNALEKGLYREWINERSKDSSVSDLSNVSNVWLTLEEVEDPDIGYSTIFLGKDKEGWSVFLMPEQYAICILENKSFIKMMNPKCYQKLLEQAKASL